MELQERVEELRASGLGVAAISYDSPGVLAAFAARRSITYPLLSDADSTTIRAFGILNTVVEEGRGPNAGDPSVEADVRKFVSLFGSGRLASGTPFPGTFIVDRDGVVTARFFEEFYRERQTTAGIMVRLGAHLDPVSGFEGSTPHLEIRATQSNAEVSFGSRFSLLLDLEPKAGIHVYAPGADDLGYRVVRLSLAPSPLLRAHPTAYPPSEIYYFEPLDERVPVYEEPFRLIQDVVVEASREAKQALDGLGALTVTGQLDYQACTDEVCFQPVSVPLSWTVTLRPLDTERTRRH